MITESQSSIFSRLLKAVGETPKRKLMNGAEKTPEALIVLGLKLDDSGSPSNELRRRVDLAGDLAEKFGCKILLSGGRRNPRPEVSEAEVMKKMLVEKGVPRDSMAIEDRSRDLVGNAYFSKPICEAHGWHDVRVVTSEYYLERTKFVFGRTFGSRFNLSFSWVTSGSSARRAIEKLFLLPTKLFFLNVSTGDTGDVRQRLRIHPLYDEKDFETGNARKRSDPPG